MDTLQGRDKLDRLVEKAFSEMDSENGATAFVGVALIVAEVRTEDNETAFYTFATDKREWIQKAMIHEAGTAIEFADVELDGD